MERLHHDFRDLGLPPKHRPVLGLCPDLGPSNERLPGIEFARRRIASSGPAAVSIPGNEAPTAFAVNMRETAAIRVHSIESRSHTGNLSRKSAVPSAPASCRRG